MLFSRDRFPYFLLGLVELWVMDYKYKTGFAISAPGKELT